LVGTRVNRRLPWYHPRPKPPVTSTSTGGYQVPEPGTLGIMGAGLIGLGLARRRRKSRANADD